MSLALCILKSEVVSVVAVIDLYLSGSGDGKSLCRCSMSFDFSHFYILLIIKFFLFAKKLWDYFFLLFMGAMTMLINLPSSTGGLSTLPSSAQASRNLVIISFPMVI